MAFSDLWSASAPLAGLLAGRGPAVATVVVVALVALGWALGAEWPRHRRLVATLDRLAAALREAGAVPQVERRLALAEAALADTPLGGLWRRYRAGIEIGPATLAATRPVEDLFGAEAVLAAFETRAAPPVIEIASAAGAAIGVLGVLGLIGSGDVLAPSAAVPLLPLGAVLAIGSLRALIAPRVAGREARAVRRLADALEPIAPHVPRDLVAYRQLRASEEHERQFVRLRQGLSEAIGSQVEKVLAERTERIPDLLAGKVAAAVAGSVNPLLGELMRIGTTIERAQAELATRAGDSFARIWREATQAETELMGRAMRSTVETLEQVTRTVQGLEAGIAGTMELAGSRLLAAGQRFGDLLESRGADLGVRLDAVKTTLGEIPGLIAGATGNAVGTLTARTLDLDSALARIPAVVSDSTGEAVRILTERLAGLDDGLARLPDSVAGATDRALSTITAAVEETALRMQDCTRAFNEAAAAELDRRVERLTGALNETAERLTEAGRTASQDLRGAGERLALGVADGNRLVGEGAETVRATLSAAVEVLEQQIVGLSGRLGEASADLARQPERMAAAFETIWNDSVERQLELVATNVKASAGALEAMNATMRGAQEGFAATVAGAAGRLAETSDRFRATFEAGNLGLAGQIDALRGALADFPAVVASSAEEAAQAVRIAVADLDGGLARIPATVAGVSQSVLDAVSERVRELDGVLRNLPGTVAAASETAIAQLGTGMAAAAHDFGKEAGDFVDKAAHRLEALGAGLAAAGETLVGQTAAAAETSRATADTVVGRLRELDTVLARLPEQASAASEAAIARIGAGMAAATHDFETRASGFAQTMAESLNGRVDALGAALAAAGRALAEQSAAAAQAHAAAAETLTARMRELEAALDRIPATLASSAEAVGDTVGGALKASATEIQDRTRALADGMAELVGQRIEALAATLERAGGGLDQAAAATGRELRAAGDQLNAGALEGVKLIGTAAEIVREQFTGAMAEMQRRVDQLAARLDTASAEFARQPEQLARTFAAVWDEAVGRQMTVLGAGIAESKDALGAVTAGLRDADRAFAKSLDEAARRLVASTTALDDALQLHNGRIAGHLDTMQAVLERLPRTVESSAEGAARAIEACVAPLSEALQRMPGSLAEAASGTIETLGAHMAGVETMLQRIPGTVSQTAERTVAAIADGVAGVVEDLRAQNRALSERIEAEAAGIVAGLGRAGGELVEAASTVGRELHTAGLDLGQRMSESFGLIGASAEAARAQIDQSVDGLGRQIERLGNRLEIASADLVRQPERMAETFSALWKTSAAAHIDVLGAAVRNATAALDAVAGGVRACEHDFTAGLARAAERLETAAGAVDAALAAGRGDLEGRIAALSDVVHALPGSVRSAVAEAADLLRGHVGELDRVVAALPVKVSDATDHTITRIGSGIAAIEGALAQVPAATATAAERALATIEEAADLLRGRVGELDRVVAALPVKVSDATDHTMARITSGIAAIEGALAQVPAAAIAAAERALATVTIVETRAKALSDGLDEAGEAMVAAVRSAGEELRRNGGALREGFAEELGASIQRISAMADAAARQVTDVAGELYGKFGTLAGALDKTADMITASSRDVAQASQAIAVTSGSLGGMARAVEAAAEPLTESVRATRETLDQLLRGLTTITEANQRGAEAITTLARGGEAARGFFEEQGVRIADLDKVIATALDHLRESMHRLSSEVSTELRIISNLNREDVQDFLKTMDERLTETLGRAVYMR